MGSIGMMNPLSVLFVSTSYPSDENDWKGRFIANLVDAIARRDDVRLKVWAPPGTLPPRALSITSPRESQWLKHLLAQGGIAHALRTEGIWAGWKALRLLGFLRNAYLRAGDAHVFHINWLQNALPIWGLPTPAVVSVLGSDLQLLKTTGIARLLRVAFRQRPCIIAPNAGWMTASLIERFSGSAEIRPIPFGVDDRWYAIRRSPPNAGPYQWIAVFRMTKKKIGSLLEWGKFVFTPPHELHLIGPMQEEIRLPEWVHYHGPASPKELAERWFPMAAGMIALSRHAEGRPQVLLEAMAAGLPVIASGIAAHRDIIRHRVNGWIVDTPSDLKEAVSAISMKNFNAQIGSAAREWVLSNVGSWDDCAERYIQAYRDILEKKP
jgi:glycosyltransferase involved in cell wall biosynthesis